MRTADASVLVRVVPPEFRGPGYTITRNNVYQWVQGDGGRPVRRLVGQLTEGQRATLPVEQAARLFGGGGQAALSALTAVGSVASIATLGVCVVGFLHVSRGLKRVEARLDRVEKKLDAVAELVGVIDQKVDQLLHLNDLQLGALAERRGGIPIGPLVAREERQVWRVDGRHGWQPIGYARSLPGAPRMKKRRPKNVLRRRSHGN